MTKDVLLGQPLVQLDVGGKVGHRLRFPLPQDLLLQLAEGGDQFEAVLLGHLRRLKHGAKRDIDHSIRGIIHEVLKMDVGKKFMKFEN